MQLHFISARQVTNVVIGRVVNGRPSTVVNSKGFRLPNIIVNIFILQYNVAYKRKSYTTY
jgi:hypothetical protein